MVLDGFRVDGVSAAGELIEVQSGPLAPLREKLGRLLEARAVRVVKPVVLSRRVIRRLKPDGDNLSARLSPKRGALLDIFDDFVGLARVFPHPNLTIEVLGVTIDEVRIPRRRWPGYRVADRLLREVVATWTLNQPADLWGLLPDRLPDPFTTKDIAERLGRPSAFAERVAYCLRHSGATEISGKQGNRRVYIRVRPSEPIVFTKGVSHGGA